MVTRVPIYLGGTGESTQAAAQAALGLHTSNSVAFTTVTIGAVNVLANDYATLISATTNPIITGNVIINSNSANDALRITQIGSGNAFVVEDSANPDATPTVITREGDVIVGGTAAIPSYLYANPQLFVMGGSAGGQKGGQFTVVFSNDTVGPSVELGKSRSTTVGTVGTIVQDGDTLGIISFNGDDGTDLRTPGATIRAQVDGTPGTNDMPGRLVFSTTGDGASTPTERMRIDSTGNVGIGTSSPNVLLHLSGSSTTARARIASTSAGASAFDGSGAGLELLAGNMNTTSKYTPAIKFGTTDVDFTTTNPKFGAAIVATAVQAYSLDTAGGMNLEFWTAPVNPGTGSGLVQNMTLTSTGRLGIGTTSPDYPLSVQSGGDAQISLKNSSGNTEAYIATAGAFGSAGVDDLRIRSDAANIVFGFSGTETVRFTSTGNVGIGTATPAATLDVVGTFSDAKANTIQQTLTDAATIAWDASLGRVATVTLGASRTFGAPTNLKVGTYILHVIQGGTGSYTITWNGVFKWTAATAPTLSTAVGRRDIFSFISDGTNLYGAMIPDVR